MGFFNFFVLRPLGATTQQQNQSAAVLAVANPIPRAAIDPQLVDTATQAFPVTAGVLCKPVQSGHDATPRDEAGHLLGEYSSTGTLVEETIWLGDIPVATLRPNGTSVSVYYIHTDQLNTPRQVTRPSDNRQMGTWFSDPFGTTVANINPAGAGAFAYNLRFPG